MWVSEPVWTGAKNLAPTGIRSPVCPVGNESLYRLSYPDPRSKINIFKGVKVRYILYLPRDETWTVAWKFLKTKTIPN